MEIRIKDIPAQERPREKALKKGISSLSDEELLALLLNKGLKGKNVLEIARDLLIKFRSLAGLASAPWSLFIKIRGINNAKAISLGACFEIARRIERERPYQSPLSSQEIYEHHRLSMAYASTEKLLLLFYNKKGQLIREEVLYEGTENSLPISARGIISEALLTKASLYIILHNHPSGTVVPSRGELTTTLALKKTGLSFGLTLFDHIIISRDSFYSFRDNGMI